MIPDATHLFALATAIRLYGTRVLEIGAGWYSTSLIHGVCPPGQAATLEEDPVWINRLTPLVHDGIILAKDIVGAARNAAAENKWTVVFIDCYLGEDRVKCASFFLELPCCVVCHDTERDYWKPLLARVRYQRHFSVVLPRTSFLSNVLNVTQ